MQAVRVLLLVAFLCHVVLGSTLAKEEKPGMELSEEPKSMEAVRAEVTQRSDGLHDVSTPEGSAQTVTPVDDAKGATVTAQRVANTLNGLGHALQNMYKQVDADEHMFKSFKEQVLEDEVAKTNVDLSWPAIQDLIKSEVAVGRQNLDNQLSQFKIDVLDVVQKGLDALRSDLRATVTAGYVAKTAVAPPDTHSVDEDEHLPKPSVGASVDRFLATLDAPISVKKDIETYVNHKLSPESLSTKLDDHGLDAMSALRQMEGALRGKLSSKDLRSEIFGRLEDLTKDYLKHPSPSAKAALEALKSSLLDSLNELKEKADSAHAAADVPVAESSSANTENAGDAAKAKQERDIMAKEREETEKIGRQVTGELKRGTSEAAADDAVAAAEKVLEKETSALEMSSRVLNVQQKVTKDAESLAKTVQSERTPSLLERESEVLPLP